MTMVAHSNIFFVNIIIIIVSFIEIRLIVHGANHNLYRQIVMTGDEPPSCPPSQAPLARQTF